MMKIGRVRIIKLTICAASVSVSFPLALVPHLLLVVLLYHVPLLHVFSHPREPSPAPSSWRATMMQLQGVERGRQIALLYRTDTSVIFIVGPAA